MSLSDNPRAVAGDNQSPDYAKMETERLVDDYGNLAKTTEELLEEARNAPKEINDDETSGQVADLVVRIRGAAKRIEGIRELEKEPYLRRGGAVDQFFNRMYEKLTRRTKADPAGAADVLHARVNDWNQRKLDAERKRLAEIERQEREKAIAAQREADERERLAAIELQKQADAEESAARARKPENIEAHETEAETRARSAGDLLAAAQAHVRDAAAATQAAEDAGIDSRRKPADHVRQRTEGGTLNTMRQVGEAKLVDKMKVDLEVLRPFLKDDHVEMALRAWAKTTSHKTQMEGAIIRMVDETVLR